MSPKVGARFEDLPAAERAAVARHFGWTKSSKPRTRSRGSGGSSSGNTTWECECGDRFTTWAAVKRHPCGVGHGRISVVLLDSGTVPPVTSAPQSQREENRR